MVSNLSQKLKMYFLKGNLEEIMKKTKTVVLETGVLALGIMFLILFVMKCSPFGGNSLACMDADIQYLDFYSYYKDVLTGNDDFYYTLTKALGGSGFALFGYYLSSPFCLLVLLFKKENLHACFNIIVALKVTLAAMTCAYFLLKRFEKKLQKNRRYYLVVILALGYALGQYSIAQCSNIMWLDGVYMLPLILLGVYRVVLKEKNSCWKLSVTVGYTIIANWYSAGIDCMFSIFWLLLELVLSTNYFLKHKVNWKQTISTVFRYGAGMFTGVLLSAALFLPTIGILGKSSKGNPEFLRLLDSYMHGNVLNTVRRYTYGAISDYGNVALFCGSIAIVAAFSVFIARDISKRAKIASAGLGIFSVLICYWNPFFVLFSLLKNAESYWYRYSYVSIMGIIFIAAIYLLTTNMVSATWISRISAGIFAVALVVVNKNKIDRNVILTVIGIIVAGILIDSILDERNKTKIQRRIAIFACIFTLSELAYNATLLIQTYSVDSVDYYAKYVREQSTQIEKIKLYDGEQYRINQTSNRGANDMQITAYYDEGLAYNYMSLCGYTSSPDGIQNDFMDRLGYRKCSEALNVVNTSVLGADSLLGTKYILSKFSLKGLIKNEQLPQANGKDVYENPFALPMAFVYDDNDLSVENENPFEYQNALYSKLYGEKIQIYKPVEYMIEQEGDVINGQDLKYHLKLPQGDYIFYGNIPCNSEINATITIDQNPAFIYSQWLSQSVFYIPVENCATDTVITLSSNVSYDVNQKKVQFYALDLRTLKKVSQKIQEREIVDCSVKNGNISMKVENAEKNQRAFISISYDSGWTVKRNGEVIYPELVGDCLYSIPLELGTNEIEMQYHVVYLKTGIILSIVGILLVGVMMYYEKRKGIRERKDN